MRPTVIAVSAVLLVSVQACARPGRGQLLREYDELESCTTVNASVFRYGPKERSLFTFDAQAMHRDTAPPADPIREATFAFGVAYGPDEGTTDEPGLSLVVDDSVPLRYPGRFGRPFPSEHIPGGMHVRVYVRVPAADLRRIARAAKVSGTVERREFALDAAQIAVLRQLSDFMARSPGAPVPVPGEFSGRDCDSFPWSPNHLPYQDPGEPGAPGAAADSVSPTRGR